MALDLSGRTDDEIRLAHNELRRNPQYFHNNPTYRSAIIEEYARRFGGEQDRAAGEPPNVRSNNDAAATPVTPDPEVRPRKPRRETAAEMRSRGNMDESAGPIGGGLKPGETLDEYGENYGAAIRSEFPAKVARRNSQPDPDQEEYNEATEVMPWGSRTYGGNTMMVDGVEVPVHHIGGDGTRYYREGDLRRAREAKADRELRERISRDAKENMAKYGDGSRRYYEYKRDEKGNLITDKGGRLTAVPTSPADWNAKTPEERELAATQAANLVEKRRSESRQVRQDIELSNRPGMRALRDEREGTRDFLRRRNMLAGGSQNVNSGNQAMWNQLAMLDPAVAAQVMLQNMPINSQRADIEKAHNEQLTALGLRVAQGQGFQDMDAAERRMNQQRLQGFRAIAGKAKSASVWGDEQQNVLEALEEAGASPEERAMIMDELFGPQAAPGAMPGSGQTPVPGDPIPSDVRAWGGII